MFICNDCTIEQSLLQIQLYVIVHLAVLALLVHCLEYSYVMIIQANNNHGCKFNCTRSLTLPCFAAQAKKKSKIYEAQTDLEKVQRQEEDVLMEVFRAERTQEKKKIDKEIDEEWEERLRELTANFDADRDKRGGHRSKDDDKKVRVASRQRIYMLPLYYIDYVVRNLYIN